MRTGRDPDSGGWTLSVPYLDLDRVTKTIEVMPVSEHDAEVTQMASVSRGYRLEYLRLREAAQAVVEEWDALPYPPSNSEMDVLREALSDGGNL